MYEGRVKECINKYQKALYLLEGISLYATDALDKQRLDKCKFFEDIYLTIACVVISLLLFCLLKLLNYNYFYSIKNKI